MRRTTASFACVLLSAALAWGGAQPALAAEEEGRHRIRGEVLKVEGDKMWIKADEGQQVEVDLRNLARDSRRSLNKGDRVQVLGDVTGGDPQKPSKFEARGIRGPDVKADMPGDRDRGRLWGREDGGQRLRGEVTRVEGDTFWLRASDGHQVQIDMSQLPRDTRRSIDKGDDVVVFGDVAAGNANRPTRFQARGIRGPDVKDDWSGGWVANNRANDRGDRGRLWGREDGDRRLRGVVTKVEGDYFWVRATDGHQVQVDMSRLPRDTQRSVDRGDEVVVFGDVLAGSTDRPTKFHARGVRGPDVKDDWSGGGGWIANNRAANRDNNNNNRAANSKIRGEVVKVEGNKMWLRESDGHQVEVDISRLAGDSRKSINRGDQVVVTGDASMATDASKPNRFVAYGISGPDVKDDSSALPRNR